MSAASPKIRRWLTGIIVANLLGLAWGLLLFFAATSFPGWGDRYRQLILLWLLPLSLAEVGNLTLAFRQAAWVRFLGFRGLIVILNVATALSGILWWWEWCSKPYPQEALFWAVMSAVIAMSGFLSLRLRPLKSEAA